MRHFKRGRKLNRTASHRSALLSNLASAFVINKQIITTQQEQINKLQIQLNGATDPEGSTSEDEMDASSSPSLRSTTDQKRRRSSSDKPPQSDDDNLSPPVKDDPSLKKRRGLSKGQEPASESGISTAQGGSDSATFISHTSEVEPTAEDQKSDSQGGLISDGPQGGDITDTGGLSSEIDSSSHTDSVKYDISSAPKSKKGMGERIEDQNACIAAIRADGNATTKHFKDYERYLHDCFNKTVDPLMWIQYKQSGDFRMQH